MTVVPFLIKYHRTRHAARVRMAEIASAVAQLWRSHVYQMLHPYRPEFHYMRGPGPKWREKHGARPAGNPD
jgi:hypothetical protein